MTPARPRPQLCVGAVVVHDAQLLLVRRGRPPGQGLWSLPGGRVERGETMRAAVERELWEETAVRGRCTDLVGWVERIAEDHYVIFDFAVIADLPITPTAGDDADEARMVPFDGLHDLELVGGLWEFLTDHGVIPGR